jgi:nucleotide-binding universal stress UspA family protein
MGASLQQREFAKTGRSTIMTVPEAAPSAPVVVGVDGSPASIAALRKAAELAGATGSPLRVVAAWMYPSSPNYPYLPDGWSPEDDARRSLDAAIAAAFPDGEPAGLDREVVEKNAASALIDESRSASMVVVGSRGHGGFAGLLLGSVSSAVAEHAACPVLVLH